MGKWQEEPEHEANNERWLLTYSDLITLLMIFFVLLYTISNVNSKKFSQLAASLQNALGEKSGQIVGDAPGPSFTQGVAGVSEDVSAVADNTQDEKNINQVQAELEKYIEQQGLKGKVEITSEARGLVISLKETLLFSLGSARISPEAQQVLHKVANSLVPLPNDIRIEGNTDDLPINTPQFHSNWELSATRATNVVEFLIDACNLPPQRLSATGYGQYRPIVPNTSEINRERNRRVDIVILKNEYSFTEPSNK